MIIDRARQLRAVVESMATGLDDSAALENTELFPAWHTDTAYVVGDRVRHDGILYKCLIAHTSQSDWIPSNAVSLWARVLIPDPDIIPEWVQPDSTNPYMTGDRVTYDGKTWESTIDNNVWQPGVYGWVEV